MLSNNEIVTLVKEKLGLEEDQELAEYLSTENSPVSKQSVSQFRVSKGDQIPHKLLSALLKNMREPNKKHTEA